MLGYYYLKTFGKLCEWIDVFEQVDILERNWKWFYNTFFKTTVLTSISGLNYRFCKYFNNIGPWHFVLSWVRTTTTTYIQTEIFKPLFWAQTVNVSTANSTFLSITILSLSLYRWGSEKNATNISSLHETRHLKVITTRFTTFL